MIINSTQNTRAMLVLEARRGRPDRGWLQTDTGRREQVLRDGQIRLEREPNRRALAHVANTKSIAELPKALAGSPGDIHSGSMEPSKFFDDETFLGVNYRPDGTLLFAILRGQCGADGAGLTNTDNNSCYASVRYIDQN